MRYTNRITVLVIFFFLATLGIKAQVHAPAPVQTQPIAIVGATAHLGTGEVIKNALIAFESGKLTIVTAANLDKRDLSKYTVIDATGMQIYPGFIAPNTNLGLVEINAVRATKDYREVGNFNPHVRALIAYDTDSEIIPTVRSMGILAAQITPEGGQISGRSSVVSLSAWNWEDAVIKADEGIHLHWPRVASFNRHTRSVKANKRYDQQINDIQAYFKEAKAYTLKTTVTEKNLRFEAMKPLFTQKANLYIHANTPQGMIQGVSLAETYHINPVIVGGNDSWMITDFLKEHHVPVILNKTHRLPANADDDVSQPFKTPQILQEAGVLFCISINGGWSSWGARNIPFQAGQAVAFGLDYEAAIQAISINPAKIMGIADQMGSIETGKDATLIIVEGDVLDMRTSKVIRAFFQGRDLDLHDKQKELWEKYEGKYGG